jgi:ATP-dependent Clp protease ATP-binding subunit ClpA
MMLERFTSEARAIVAQAQEHARRLGHRYVGTEHLLLAAVGSPAAAGDIVRGQGLTPERVEQEILHRIGRGATAGLFGDLDRDALASIGIDLDAVRARVEAAFGADALARAGLEVQGLEVQTLVRQRRRLPLPGRARRRGPSPLLNVDAVGRYRPGAARTGGRLPFTLPAKKVLERSLREAVARHDGHIGAEHIVLALIGMDNGPVPVIMSGLGVPVQTLRAAILDRYRQAG